MKDTPIWNVDPSTVVWITVLTPEYTSSLLERLLSMGLQISSGDPSNTTLQSPGRVSSVICIRVHHSIDNTVEQVIENVRFALDSLKAYYYSIVASGACGTAWGLGNIAFEIQTPEPPNKNRHLRLISNKENNIT